MDTSYLTQEFKKELVEDILPFWARHGWDREQGGMMTALDQGGEILDSDKSVWFQGRTAWTYATAYRTIQSEPEYLAIAQSCLSFIKQHCVDEDGRYFFRVTRSENRSSSAAATYSVRRSPPLPWPPTAVLQGSGSTARMPMRSL